jgi:hypothetical protein
VFFVDWLFLVQILDHLQKNASVEVTVAPAAAIREESIGSRFLVWPVPHTANARVETALSPIGTSAKSPPAAATTGAETTFDLSNSAQTQ